MRPVIAVLTSLAIFIFAIPGVATNAPSDDLLALKGLAKGAWIIRFRDGISQRQICFQGGQELIQLHAQHSGKNCSFFLVEDRDSQATIQYNCQGDGYGRTEIRVETRSLIQIESQGIAAGRPFNLAGEGRRTGSC